MSRIYHIVNYLHEYYPIEETAYSVTNLASKQDYSILFSHFPELQNIPHRGLPPV